MADPICTFLFSVFVLCTTVTILRDVFRILMEGKDTPLSWPDPNVELICRRDAEMQKIQVTAGSLRADPEHRWSHPQDVLAVP